MSLFSQAIATSLVLLFACTSQICGQGLGGSAPAQIDGVVKHNEIKITASPIPIPAMRYQLSFSEVDLLHGDAAAIYYRAFLMFSSIDSGNVENRQKIAQWLEMPIEELPIEEVEKVVSNYRLTLQEWSFATRHSIVNWGYEAALGNAKGSEIYAILLPEIQEASKFSHIVNLRIKLRLAKRDFEGAISDLRGGFAFAEHLFEGKFLVSQLVAMSVERSLYKRLQEWQQIPGSPNLYWAIAQLTQPRYDIRRAIRFELDISRRAFGIVSEAALEPKTKEEWKAFFDESAKDLRSLANLTSNGRDATYQNGNNPGSFLELLKSYSTAKQNLASWGYSEDEVEKMSVVQVVVLQTKLAHDYIFSEYEKLTYLPYDRAIQELSRVEKKLNAEGYLQSEGSREIFPIAKLVLPALERTLTVETQAKTTLFEIQFIECLRDHAANNKELPTSMDQLSLVPTGQLDSSVISVKFHADKQGVEFDGGVQEGNKQIKSTIRLVK